ncbi:STAS domain-containing protein [Pseudoxanthomonas suwonensis]|uniref:STAS domain-containing protein n=1 Tax=Pseudoxanthomonas suwonensis TaxID=314722 RepID=A0A0E3UMZ8_9GAMM|nr:STAS domain-containing protein [Pseudoxanthomonas suwonensis]AKC86746.1 hypothetical protein WQ53_08235 [Pseudoxanthomonas suwonensis]
MAHADPASGLKLDRDGPVLRLAGPLDRTAAIAHWPALPPLLDGVRVLDVSGVQRLDSAGLALLAEACAQVAARGGAPQVVGSPAGLAELRAAYRLDEALAFADPSP